MTRQVRNRDKKIALLLTAAFAWLFIGSLIIFHQEHVLGKHFRLNCQAFISPKTKDKKEYTYNVQNPLVKSQDNGLSAGILPKSNIAGITGISLDFQSKEYASFLINDALVTQVPLRAPPAA
jgi:hypothetical protein